GSKDGLARKEGETMAEASPGCDGRIGLGILAKPCGSLPQVIDEHHLLSAVGRRRGQSSRAVDAGVSGGLGGLYGKYFHPRPCFGFYLCFGKRDTKERKKERRMRNAPRRSRRGKSR